MEIICSKTGSSGNFSVISDGASSLAIDCGVPWDKALRMSSYGLLDACALLVSHGHGDHLGYINQFVKGMMNVFMSKETWDKGIENGTINRWTAEVYNDNVSFFDGSQFKVGTFVVKPFKVPHTNTDGSPCDNSGFLIYSTATKEKMLWVTDCAYITQKFPPLDYICIECNYVDVEDYSKEAAFTNIPLESRRVQSHLSLNRCVDFLKKQDLSKIKFVKLLHLTHHQGIIEDVIRERLAKEFPSLKIII